MVTVVAAAYLHLEVTAHLFGQVPLSSSARVCAGTTRSPWSRWLNPFGPLNEHCVPVAFTPEEAALFGPLEDAGMLTPPGKHGLLSRASGVMTSLPSWFVLGGTRLLMARNLRALRQDWQRRPS